MSHRKNRAATTVGDRQASFDTKRWRNIGHQDVNDGLEAALRAWLSRVEGSLSVGGAP